MSDSEREAPGADPSPHRRELSWRAMLVLLVLAVLTAAALAYLLVRAFMHPH